VTKISSANCNGHYAKPIDENITSFNANRLIGKFSKRIVEWFQ
jgi:hypothetical protein